MRVLNCLCTLDPGVLLYGSFASTSNKTFWGGIILLGLPIMTLALNILWMQYLKLSWIKFIVSYPMMAIELLVKKDL